MNKSMHSIEENGCHSFFKTVKPFRKKDALRLTINKFLQQQAQIHQKHVTSWVYILETTLS
jgi:hypothetical protein